MGSVGSGVRVGASRVGISEGMILCIYGKCRNWATVSGKNESAVICVGKV
jgi:hypothetical protein